MESNQVNLEEIQKLIRIADQYGLEELTVAERELSVTVRGSAHSAPAPAAGECVPAAPPPRRKRADAPARAAEPAASRFPLVSPMTGVFYRAPSPDAPAFVEVGDVVETGQTIGMIEAMKVFSEVPAEASGRVAEVVAQNGKLVQADDVLILLEQQEDENQV